MYQAGMRITSAQKIPRQESSRAGSQMTKSWHSQLLEPSERATDGVLAVRFALQMFSLDMILDMVEAWSMHCNSFECWHSPPGSMFWATKSPSWVLVCGIILKYCTRSLPLFSQPPLSLCLFSFVRWESWAVILLSAAFGKPSHSLSCTGYLELEHPLFQEYSAVFVHFGADVVVGEHACVCTHSGGRLSSSFLWEVSYEFLFISGSLTSW